MKNIKIIIAIAVTLLVIGAGVFVYMDMAAQEKMATDKKQAEQVAQQQQLAKEQDLQSKTKCVKVNGYFVITLDRGNSVGQDILVKTNAGNLEMACKYVVNEGDFELKNADPQYFKAIEKNSLVIDVGTGPSGRSWRVYDLGDKSLVTEKKYFDEFKVASGTLSYFALSKQKADAKNCSEYKTLMKDLGNASLVVEKLVNLETYSVKETKNTKCVGEQ